MATVKQIIEAAHRRLGVLAQGEALDAAQVQDGLAALRDLLEAWSLKGIYIPFRTVETFNLDSTKSVYTWSAAGSPDFNSAPPVEIYTAFFSDGAGVNFPVKEADATAWAHQRFRAHAARPEFFWFEPGETTGTVRFETQPIDATVTFVSGKILDQTQGLTETLGLPPGFERLGKWALAEELAPEYEVEIVPGSTLWRQIRDAKRTVFNRYARVPIARFDDLRRGYVDYDITSGPGQ